jgi:acyl carrier protein
MENINIQELISKIESDYDELEPGALTPDAEFRKLIHWNSMNSLVMTVMIEYEYKVIIKDEELKTAQTVQQLADLINAKKNANG